MKILLKAALVLAATAMPYVHVQAEPAMRQVPARELPVPDTVSPEDQALIGAPLSPIWNVHPTSADEWKEFVAKVAARAIAGMPELLAKLNVKREQAKIAGITVYVITPETVPPENHDRLLVHVHGGGYVLGPGEAGNREAILMAGYGRMKVVSIDYRMPPDFPYPAALDDAMAVWGELVKTNDPNKMAIFGTSTGGGMTPAMVLRAKAEKLPLPAAIAPGTPWSDMTKTGDSYFANEMVDNVLVSNDGWLGDAAKLYATDTTSRIRSCRRSMAISTGFPPTVLTTGTRDLFLSNTVRVHRKLREVGVEAMLNVFEGQSHAQYLASPYAPETKEALGEIAQFFDAHLAK
jgi:epsilon-lactone hydrolase